MGLELGKVAPPSDRLPFLKWDPQVLRSFLGFVKEDEEGSFRITKWKMLEFIGTEHLHEITSIFAIFEEAGETSVSSMQLGMALLLCNQNVSVSFKVLECLSFFDWSGEGMLSFFDVLFLFQASVRALSFCIGGMPRDTEREILEDLCREAVVGDTASVEAISNWAQRSESVMGLLLRLTPHDADMTAQRSELLQSAPSGAQQALRSSPLPQLPAGSPQPGDRTSAETPKSDRSDVPGRAGSKAQSVSGTQRPSNVPEDDGHGNLFIIAAPSERELREGTLAQHLESARLNLQRLIEVEEGSELLHLGSKGEWSAPAVRVASLERQWARMAGSALPSLPTMWTLPMQAVPFSSTASKQVLRIVFCDWVALNRTCAINEAEYEAAHVAAVLSEELPHNDKFQGFSPSVRRAAEQKLASWMGDQPQAITKDEKKSRAAMEGELGLTEDRALQAARAWETLAASIAASPTGPPEPRLRCLRRDAQRMEGAIAYLDSLAVSSQEVQSLIVKAKTLLRQYEEAMEALHEPKRQLEESRDAFLATMGVRAVLSECLREPVGSSWAALQRRARELSVAQQPGGGSLGPRSLTAANAREAAEPRWRRSEGALIAARALIRGGALHFELFFHEASQLSRGARAVEAGLQWTFTNQGSGRSAEFVSFNNVQLATVVGSRLSEVDSSQLVAGLGLGTPPPPGGRPRKRLAAMEALLGALDDLSGGANPQDPVEQLLPQVVESALKRVIASAERGATSPKPGNTSPPNAGGGARQSVLSDDGRTSFRRHSTGSGHAIMSRQASVLEEAEGKEAGEADGEAQGEEDGTENVAEGGEAEGAEEKPVVAEVTVEGLRTLRFERHAREASAAVLATLLPEGLHIGVAKKLEEAQVKAREEHEAAESHDAPKKRRQDKWRDCVEHALMRSLGVTSMEAVGQQTLTVTQGALRAALLQEHFCMHRRGAADQLSQTVLPMVPQPTLTVPVAAASGARAQQASDLSALGFSEVRRHEHAAQAVGSLQALEFVAMMTLAREVPPDEDDEARGLHADALHRCSELKAHARLLEAAAAHRLTLAELEMRRLAIAPQRDAANKGLVPCPVKTTRESMLKRRIELNTNDPILKASAVTDEVLAACWASDVRDILQVCAEDPQLRHRWPIVRALLASVEKEEETRQAQWRMATAGLAAGVTAGSGVGVNGGGSSLMQPRSAPPMQHPSEWWRGAVGGPGEAGIRSCPRCMEVARLTWLSILLVEPNSELPRSLLQEHAAAFRIWAAAQHRVLAMDAVTYGTWDGARRVGCNLQPRLRLLELRWRGELARQQVGNLATVQRVCLQHASNFLHPLSPSAAEFIIEADLEEHSTRAQGDIQSALVHAAASELTVLRASMQVGRTAWGVGTPQGAPEPGGSASSGTLQAHVAQALLAAAEEAAAMYHKPNEAADAAEAPLDETQLPAYTPELSPSPDQEGEEAWAPVVEEPDATALSALPLPMPALAPQQVVECAELAEAMASGLCGADLIASPDASQKRPGTAARKAKLAAASEAEARAVECWGVLRGLEQLKIFCAAAGSRAGLGNPCHVVPSAAPRSSLRPSSLGTLDEGEEGF